MVRDDGGGSGIWCVYVTHKRHAERGQERARGTEIACGGDVGLKRN